MVRDIGEEYFRLNDMECTDLKGMLKGMEGQKAGRVRLSSFYQKGLYSHWGLNEKVDYLRTLGALDESDPKNPQVIAANYVMARNNCLQPSNMYAICCRNECEDLMGHLETKLGSPNADPKQVAALVAAMPSGTVAAPRTLSGALLGRLDQVAATNGGFVPIHGRLFAQWMHHAYPRECPYPHEAGTTNPQTPDEWMAEKGEELELPEDERQRKIVDDACSAEQNPGGVSSANEAQ